MHILPLLSRSYSDFGMVFCHCNATFLQIISSLSSLARSFCHITKPISVRLQQTENKSVCNFVVPCRKPCKTKRRFAKIKRHFSTTKRRFVGTKRRFVNTWFSKEYKRIGLQEVKVRLFSYLCRAKGLWLVVDWKRQQPEKLYQNKGK